MAKGFEVLSMLRPEGGWIIVEDDYDSIKWMNCEPVSREDFLAGFNQYDTWKSNKDAEALANKVAAEAKLVALGLTVDDIKTLLS